MNDKNKLQISERGILIIVAVVAVILVIIIALISNNSDRSNSQVPELNNQPAIGVSSSLNNEPVIFFENNNELEFLSENNAEGDFKLIAGNELIDFTASYVYALGDYVNGQNNLWQNYFGGNNELYTQQKTVIDQWARTASAVSITNLNLVEMTRDANDIYTVDYQFEVLMSRWTMGPQEQRVTMKLQIDNAQATKVIGAEYVFAAEEENAI